MKNQNSSQNSNAHSNRTNGGSNNRGYSKSGQGQGKQPQQQQASFFNIHTNAMGYLNRVEMIQGNSGDFIVLNFGALEGPSDRTSTTFINLTVPAKQVEEIISSFWDEINNPEIKVFASVRIAGLSATPFVFGESSKSPGALGVNYNGKLINILSLKVGHETIDLEGGRQQTQARQQPAQNQGYHDEEEHFAPAHAAQSAQPYRQHAAQPQAPAHRSAPAPRNNGYAPKQQYGSHRG